jgi:molybdate transport system substrate-binding protein
MNRTPAVVMALVALVGLVALLWPRQHQPRAQALSCYVGGTMTPVMTALAEAYRRAGGETVEVSTADSGELLATIEMQLQGDLYVAHDPFMDIAMQRGVGVNAWCLGHLFPVIVVRKGNPKNIHSLKDLYRPDVKLYLTDYRHSTLGNILPVIFERAGLDFSELNRAKNIPTHRSGSWVANQVIMEAADAALVWQAVAYLRRKDLDVVRIDEHLPVPGVDVVTSATGKRYFVAPVKVAVVSLVCSRRPRQAEKFVEFVTSDVGRRLFEQYGFEVTGHFGYRHYANGVRIGPSQHPGQR